MKATRGEGRFPGTYFRQTKATRGEGRFPGTYFRQTKAARSPAPRDDVALAVLFGSAARGDLRRGSDLDIALAWRGDAPDDRDALLATIERALGRPVDVVDLATAPPQLRFEIARDGVLVVERAPGAWSRVRARAFVDWWDFQPIARRIHRAAVARLSRSRWPAAT